MTNFYCAAPWRGLHINPQGNVKTCCAGNPNMLGNLESHSIDTILNSDVMAEIRASLAQGKPHSYCSNCVKAERFGADSERQWHNNVNPDFDYAAAGSRYHYPVIVDVRWNTTCNLSCNYCGSACSSRWASIRGESFRSGTRPYFDSVCDWLEQHYDHIHEVALVGGEPLLLPENERLLDVVPKSAIVTLITNLNVDFKRNRIVQRLAQRRQVGWSMSFDNIGQRFEYVRHGSDWSVMQQNIRTVQGFMHDQGHWGGAHAVYNVYNCTRLVEFRQWTQSQGLSVLWQNLFQPNYLDPAQLGYTVAQLAAAEITKFLSLGIATPAEHTFFTTSLQQFESVKADDCGLWAQFCQHIHDNETRWHPDKLGAFSQLWPEFEI
jgi:MoaA/NifB/PqqE/SkfB family radical SAM enzyme